MKRSKKWILIIITIAAITIPAYMYVRSNKEDSINVKVAYVKKGDISSYISGNGVIASKDRKDYFVSNPNKVEKVYVKTGDRVNKNELIIKFEAPDFSEQLKRAYIELDIAKMNLENLKRQEQDISVLSTEDKSAIEGMVNISDRIKLQEKQVDIARLSIDSIKDKIKNADHEIKSSIDGVVTNINIAEGAITPVGAPLITIENDKNIIALVNVSQYDILNVKNGQEVIIRLDSLEKQYKGIIQKINPIATKTVSGVSAETVIPVEISITDADSNIKIGFDVDADIKVCTKNDIIYVPYEAVITDRYKKAKVFVIEDGKAFSKDVKIGIESDLYMEICEGLSEGQCIILNPPQDLKDGDNVTF